MIVSYKDELGYVVKALGYAADGTTYITALKNLDAILASNYKWNREDIREIRSAIRSYLCSRPIPKKSSR